MKKSNIYISIGLTALLILGACKKIAVVPVFEIATTQAFQTVKDGLAFDNGLYSLFRARQYGTYMYYQDVQADQLHATLDYGNNDGAPYRMDASFSSDDQTVDPEWNAYYSAIANINTALGGFPGIVTTNATDAASMNQYTGDAYLARAYYYHRLVKRWAKPYEPATAATDLGVPLVLAYNLTELPARATVQACYTQILADIAKAETLLSSVAGVQGSKYFTIDCAKALEARVRLDMHDWTGAYTVAQSLISSAKYPLISTQAAFTSYWATDGTQESIMQLAGNSSELPSTNAIYLEVKTATNYDPYFVPSQDIINLYAATDIRKAAYFSKNYPVIIQGVSYPGTYVVSKYPGNPALFTGSLTNYENAPKVFRIAEMYLIAAEAADNIPNEPNALVALNALKVARGILPVASTGAQLAQDIKDERTRELAFEGTRLEDLERWHLPLTRQTPQNAAMLTGPAATFYSLTEPADFQKFVWGIPTNDMNINHNLVQNPGW